MIISQRTLHARVWPVLGALALLGLALALAARRPVPVQPSGVPGFESPTSMRTAEMPR